MRLEEIINNNYDKLHEGDLAILKYILNHKKECCELSINSLADKCNVSRTTIFRLAKKLGFKGYSEFKFHLKWKEKEVISKEIDYPQHLYKDISDTIALIEDKNMINICKLLYNAKRIFVYGTGTAQMSIARELKRSFLLGHKSFNIIEGYRELEIITPSIKKGEDIIIFISLSGNTTSFQSCLNEIAVKGIDIISITNLSNNPLARMTSYNLYVKSSPLNYKNGEIYSFSMFFILIESLFRYYVKYQEEQLLKTLS